MATKSDDCFATLKVLTVFSSDALPADPRLLVCNLDQSHREGTHLICIYVDGETGTGEYFESLGRPPIESLERYMNGACSCNWYYNDRQLQNILSAFCGYYCVYFCMLTHSHGSATVF